MLDPTHGDLIRHATALRSVALLAEGQRMSPFLDRLVAALADLPTSSASSVRSSSHLTRWLREALEPAATHSRRGSGPPPGSGGLVAASPPSTAATAAVDPSLFSLAFTGYAAATPDAVLASGLALAYACPYPASLVLDRGAVAGYSAAFGQLLRIRRILALLHALTRDSRRAEEAVRRAVRAGALPGAAAAALRSQLARVQQHRRAAMHFVEAVHAHVAHAAVQLPWPALVDGLRAAEGVAGMRAAHGRYLAAVHAACFLGDAQQAAAGVLDKLLARVDAFARQAGDLLAAVGKGVGGGGALGDRDRAGAARAAAPALAPIGRIFTALDASAVAFARQVAFAVHAASLSARSGGGGGGGGQGAEREGGDGPGASFARLAMLLDFNGYYSGLVRLR
jgi:hypothetical protein